ARSIEQRAFGGRRRCALRRSEHGESSFAALLLRVRGCCAAERDERCQCGGRRDRKETTKIHGGTSLWSGAPVTTSRGGFSLRFVRAPPEKPYGQLVTRTWRTT